MTQSTATKDVSIDDIEVSDLMNETLKQRLLITSPEMNDNEDELINNTVEKSDANQTSLQISTQVKKLAEVDKEHKSISDIPPNLDAGHGNVVSPVCIPAAEKENQVLEADQRIEECRNERHHSEIQSANSLGGIATKETDHESGSNVKKETGISLDDSMAVLPDMTKIRTMNGVMKLRKDMESMQLQVSSLELSMRNVNKVLDDLITNICSSF